MQGTYGISPSSGGYGMDHRYDERQINQKANLNTKAAKAGLRLNNEALGIAKRTI
jgi:hypothetical protein